MRGLQKGLLLLLCRWRVAALRPGVVAAPARRLSTICYGGRKKVKRSDTSFAEREERLAAQAYEALLEKRRLSKERKKAKPDPRAPKNAAPKVERPPRAERDPKKKRAAAPRKKEAAAAKAGGGRVAKGALSSAGELRAEFLGGFDEPSLMPLGTRPEVAFLGRSNVGKSSMLNALVGARKNVAVVGKTPGRTRRLNSFLVTDARGAACTLVDLPGYGFAKLSPDEQAAISKFIERYLDGRPNLKVLVFIVDARREPNDEDAALLAELAKRNLRVVLVATKIDKLKSSSELVSRLDDLADFFGMDPTFFSSVTKQGRADLWQTINDGLFAPDDDDDDDDDDDATWVLEDDDDDDDDEEGLPDETDDDGVLVF